MVIRLFVSEDIPALHHLLTSNRWEYFLNPVIDERELAVRDKRYFASDTTETLVYIDSERSLKGFIRFFDIKNSDIDSPLFIVNIDESARGIGVGTELVRRGVKYVFDTFDKIRRVEATTRVDNKAIQKLFESAGFRHEATYRKVWRVKDGKYVDSLGYAILREEFKL
ncbi:MAG: GNAT family N-acetyltransferase [Ilumatobacteraceae bacterium]